MRVVGSNGRIGPGKPNVLWNVRRRAGYREAGDTMKVEDGEGC